MQLRQSERTQAKIKIGLQGPSGSGKTMSSLLLAKGLCGSLEKVAVIDSENGSADLYAHLGPYQVLTLPPPFTPERYCSAIDVCLAANMEVIIIDSASHCWDYLIDYHASLQGNSFTNWAQITPRHKAFIDKILQSEAHFIVTMRVKQDYVLNEKAGKLVPEKVGLKAIQRDGVDYELTIVFDIDVKHHATCSKDRTNLFMGKPRFAINETTGKEIQEWCGHGTDMEMMKLKVQEATSLDDLKLLYQQYKQWYPLLEEEFVLKKAQLLANHDLSNPLNFSTNGATNP